MEKICNYPKCRNVGEFIGDFCNECTNKPNPYLIRAKEYAKKYWGKTLAIHKKQLARAKVNNALQSKSLSNFFRWPCEKCGEKAEAHHFDYNQPLKVKWLCKFHHWEEHQFLKQLV